MTPDLQCALVCEDVRLEVSGSNTLVGVINTIAAPQLPIRLIKLCVFTRWCSGEGSFQQTTRMLDQNENTMAQTRTPFRLAGEENHATNVAVFGGLEFTEPGAYPVEILLDEELVLRFPLQIILAQS
ncbi:MAG: hypothetical protein ACFCUX_05160 [Candidatus Methylacidiphilales bacterium]